MPVLHGVLDLVIVEATNLPDAGVKSAASGFLRNCMQCCLSNAELMGHVDPYCVMDVGATRRVRTRFINKSPRHVQWNEQFTLYLADEAEEFVFEIKVGGLGGRGRGAAPLRGRLLPGSHMAAWRPMPAPAPPIPLPASNAGDAPGRRPFPAAGR